MHARTTSRGAQAMLLREPLCVCAVLHRAHQPDRSGSGESGCGTGQPAVRSISLNVSADRQHAWHAVRSRTAASRSSVRRTGDADADDVMTLWIRSAGTAQRLGASSGRFHVRLYSARSVEARRSAREYVPPALTRPRRAPWRMAPQRGPHMPPRRQRRLGRLGLSGRVRQPPHRDECQRADTVRQRGGHDSLSNRTLAGDALKPIVGRARSPGRLPHPRPSAVQSRSRSLDASRLRSSDVPLVTVPTRTTDRRSRARRWSVPDRTRALFVGEEHVDHVRPCVGGYGFRSADAPGTNGDT